MPISRRRKALFFSILLSIPATMAVVLFLSWYAFGKLTFTAHFCSSFAQLDEQVGWVHKPNEDSCMGVHEKFNRENVYYEHAVITDNNGFRTSRRGTETPTNAVMFLGDSYTFGYMAPYDETFPGLYAKLSKNSVVNLGSPAYSGAQAVQLGQRWAPQLAPKAIVYFESGFWERGICQGETRPSHILKPCYWQKKDGKAELIAPREGYVQAAGNWGLRPGGMVGAGELTWSYFLVARPIAKLSQLLVRLGLLSGMADDFFYVGNDSTSARQALLRDLIALAREVRTPILIMDREDAYSEFISSLTKDERSWLFYVDKATWRAEIEQPASLLPIDERRIPHDGHFAIGTNLLVAKLINKKLSEWKLEMQAF